MPKISVVIPTYNRADVLPTALASVWNQSRKPDEVIVTDDASSDDIASVVKSFPGTQLIRLKKNSGAGNARNVGVNAASGDYIAFLDSDDYWQPTKLQQQESYLVLNPALDLICTGVTVTERSGRSKQHGAQFAEPRQEWTFCDFQNYPFSPTTWLIRKSAFEAAGGFDISLPNAEDLDLLARLQPTAKIACIPEQLVLKTNRADSLDANLAKLQKSYAVLFERHARLWKKTPAAEAKSYQHLAHMHFLHGTMADCRLCLRRAFSAQPANVGNFLLWLSSYGGRFCYRMFKRYGT
jgi:glycosyltransferase involved in cell wall biosynthesis